ncbi:TCP-1 cpn60 chaperonin family [Chlorella sorokiniana]|uniref:TCP-1 cpn60 chaperonin family n=1 Tax=Chlorella sorokiniana TaxID=3076 RepID=A0A2P6TRP6_CHLSO|nr:TCP-1 cpn60 chaperonin family [Chlorella sorokiniana]|eukprot:PRW56739.1 TCP-1 cpn60 chaperonin family [Chlorella sorokiniana]
MEALREPPFPLLALPSDLMDRVAYLLPPGDRCGRHSNMCRHAQPGCCLYHSACRRPPLVPGRCGASINRG